MFRVTCSKFLITLVALHASADTDHFERAIRPILAEHCYECHGPEKQESGIRFDAGNAFFSGDDAGPIIRPGRPDASRLIHAIRRDSDIKMPPKTPLPQEAVDALTQWVADGAPWPDNSAADVPRTMEDRITTARENHWAFQPGAKPEPPEVAHANLVQSPIDRFVFKHLEAAGLTPSPRADKRALIRRAAYALTGLPPTIAAVEAFEKDPSPDAFANVIDTYLASPHFGERWARHWLDVARYADTKGYVFEEDRFFPYSHTYRDYVINAFNEDKPYDQFIVEQLAADQLDLGENKRPLAAMGFLTLGRRFLSNIHDITDDRIDVVTRGMMGLTVSCARCHEHKYDPIPTEDYYALYGVFRSSRELATEDLPLIETPDESDAEYQEFKRILDEKQTAWRNFRRDLHVDFLAHARDRAAGYLLAAHDTRDMTDQDPFRKLAKERDLHAQLVDRWRNYLKPKYENPDPIFGAWTAFAKLPAKTFADEAPTIAKQIAENDLPDIPLNPRVSELFKGDPPKSLEEVAERYGQLFDAIDTEWRNRLAAETQIAQHSDGAPTVPNALRDANAEAVRQVLYSKDSPANFPESTLDKVVDIPTRNENTRMRTDIERHQNTHPGRPDRAMVIVDNDKPFDPYVFNRGKPGAKGPQVERRFLTVLADDEPRPFTEGSGRLELARAIASRDNPLTARVFVNRVWMHLFDKPLVSTPSDFGLRSDPPTHPELLDYLAWRFMEDGWSVKNLIRTIMLSHTYQQASVNRPECRDIDPENTLLWRQNRQRLDFEGMRDSLLMAAGALDPTVGGHAANITREPYPTRRTIYARIERQNLPALFRTFDFASPDTHAPQRYETTVPQQALYLLNSPFVVEQARALINRDEAAKAEGAERIRALYRVIFQREPTTDEIALGDSFIKQHAAQPPPRPEPPVWQYGYGSVDDTQGTTTAFTPLPNFQDNAWRGGPKMPDEKLGWVSLHARGGHPGNPGYAAIRRWVAPRDARVRITGVFRHENGKGDGVHGYIVHSRDGVLWQGDTHNSHRSAIVKDVTVRKGDILDFVASCKANTSYDSFLWSPDIHLIEALDGNPGGRLEWTCRGDFSGPPPDLPPPLTSWQAYAQTLLMTNEFMFVD